jgi:predicted nucleotidyltransferase
MNLLQNHTEQLNQLCKNFKVKNLYAFGSVLTSRLNEKSDIDLLVTFDNVSLDNYADNYYDLKFSLEKLLNREIDLLEEKAIKNPYLKKSIDEHKKLIYAA